MVADSLRRWRIRRLYNRQQFARARRLSEDELGGKNHAFALDIIVRSLYNEGRWQALLDVAKRHPETNHDTFVQKAQRRLSQAREEAEGIPEPDEKKPWDASELLSNWSQEGRRLWLRHPWGWVHWDMPEEYSLGDTHPALLHLALEILLFPWVPETKRWDVEQRSPGLGVRGFFGDHPHGVHCAAADAAAEAADDHRGVAHRARLVRGDAFV